MQVQTVGVCGYFSTGSSAVLDLLCEFSEVQVFDDFEFTIAVEPDGLMDLDFHLNSYRKYVNSFIAIRRFRMLMCSIFHSKTSVEYRKATKGKIKRLTDSYLSEITQVSWRGLALASVISIPRKCIKKFIQMILLLMCRRKIYCTPLANIHMWVCRKNMQMSSFPENFLYHTKKYINSILQEMGRDPQKITVLDQAFDAQDPVSSFKYYDNPKAIIVERDPRDLYLFAKYYLPYTGHGRLIPTDNVEDFIKYYKLSRKRPPSDVMNKDILRVNFESLVYDYEDTVLHISKFIGIKDHERKGSFFIPDMSRNNTQLFKKYLSNKQDIKAIESELFEHIFPFEKFADAEASGSMFSFRSPLRSSK